MKVLIFGFMVVKKKKEEVFLFLLCGFYNKERWKIRSLVVRLFYSYYLFVVLSF